MSHSPMDSEALGNRPCLRHQRRTRPGVGAGRVFIGRSTWWRVSIEPAYRRDTPLRSPHIDADRARRRCAARRWQGRPRGQAISACPANRAAWRGCVLSTGSCWWSIPAISPTPSRGRARGRNASAGAGEYFTLGTATSIVRTAGCMAPVPSQINSGCRARCFNRAHSAPSLLTTEPP
jgi:hypothetical protein